MIQPDERTGNRDQGAVPAEANGPAATVGHQDSATAGPAGGPLPEMSAPALEPLRSLGEYLLLEKLGQGGMGAVFKARHTQLDRIVAVKVMAPALVADPQAVARFQREMKAIGRLDHPNIVRAHDARQIDQTHFLVMEYVDGIDLAELVRRLGPLPVCDACELIRQAAIGLQYAHQHGLVHRDIKPSNLILTRLGEVKILDLGLARIRTAESPGDAMTATGQVMGTPDFIAPEQVTDSHLVDIRADIYSLGCTFYKLLSGRAPFESPKQPSAALKMVAHVRDPAPPIRRLRGEVPGCMAAVLDCMLGKQPGDRFSEPREVVEALEADSRGSSLHGLARRALGDWTGAATESPRTTVHFADGPGSTRGNGRDGMYGEAARGARCLTKPVWCFGIVVMTVLAALGAWTLFQPDEDPSEPAVLGGSGRQILVDGQDATGRGNGRDEPSRRPSDETGSDVQRNEDHGDDQSVVPAAVAQDRLGPSDRIVLSWPAHGELQPSLWLMRAGGERRMLLSKGDAAFDTEPKFSPDGRHIAFIRTDRSMRRSNVWVCRSDGSNVRELVSARGTSERLFSPVWISETRIYYTRDPKINQLPDMEAWQIGLDDVTPRRVFEFRKVLGNRAGLITDVSPNMSRLLIIAQQPGNRLTSDVLTTDLMGGDVKTVWQDDCQDVRAIWAPDGRQIAWHHTYQETVRDRLSLFTVAIARLGSDGEWTGTLPPNKKTLVAPLAWSPDGGALLCARIFPGTGQKMQTAFLLINDQFRPLRVLFELEGGRGLAAGRHAGRLADWAKLPPDVIRQIQARIP